MAGSSTKPTRSISLPSRLHPNSQKIEAKLSKLKTNWESSFSSRETPLGSDNIQSSLADLAELYSSTEELIHSPLIQQALLQHHSRKVVEETLDASIGLLDACGAARDLLLRMKENVQSLQSALRRKVIGDSSIESNVQSYINFRRNARKEVSKSLRALKTMQSNNIITLDLDHPLQMVITLFRELSTISMAIFRSLFVFLSMPAAARTKASSGWSLISKLFVPMSFAASERGRKIFNEVDGVDISVWSLQGQLIRKNSGAKIDVGMVKRRLESLDGCIEGLEAGLDSLFRCLIQHRVSLLNLLTP